MDKVKALLDELKAEILKLEESPIVKEVIAEVEAVISFVEGKLGL